MPQPLIEFLGRLTRDGLIFPRGYLTAYEKDRLYFSRHGGTRRMR